ncbi:hypothetical protein BB560_005645 [Smittium megazygosporum]|uniref:Large ribosomal subunit protein uL2m n=1 Tax=Smittium megazygosporum TaxID=133381 RepID=A0A2T9Z1U6_9FUNG|nr:hypothetical protein BB560_005645 [Smittium megazygosporum]
MSLSSLFSKLRIGKNVSSQVFQKSAGLISHNAKTQGVAASLFQCRYMGVVTDDGVFKTWKPITPGLRGKKVVSRKHLWKGKPVRELTIAKRNKGGRNFTGRITCRHRGGGAKRRIRLVDFYRKKPGKHEVVRLEYDPGRTAFIALLRHTESGELSYILAPDNLKPGMVVESYMERLNTGSKDRATRPSAVSNDQVQQDQSVESTENFMSDESEILLEKLRLSKSLNYDVGNCLPLKFIPPGTTIHNIGIDPRGKGKLARSAGSSAKLLATGEKGLAIIKLCSGEVRKVPVHCCATIGSVSNPNHKHENLGKAGANRHRGWRPTVRGTAMNKHDHPNGGGRGKSKGNRQSTSPWGKLAKGGKTRKNTNPLVIKSRKAK